LQQRDLHSLGFDASSYCKRLLLECTCLTPTPSANAYWWSVLVVVIVLRVALVGRIRQEEAFVSIDDQSDRKGRRISFYYFRFSSMRIWLVLSKNG
jgi:hypothetical protein